MNEQKQLNEEMTWLFEQPYLTARQLAERYKCTQAAIIKKINGGKFFLTGRPSAYKQRGEWRVLVAAVANYEETIEVIREGNDESN